ncbi:hypothetical protein [Corynebacterium sp. CCM 9203]|uniref:hypothetical protein n=1 Tax=Corynebacterium sp. CCM 9203 TaxID=3057615 RepID=UPI0035255893
MIMVTVVMVMMGMTTAIMGRMTASAQESLILPGQAHLSKEPVEKHRTSRSSGESVPLKG